MTEGGLGEKKLHDLLVMSGKTTLSVAGASMVLFSGFSLLAKGLRNLSSFLMLKDPGYVTKALFYKATAKNLHLGAPRPMPEGGHG